MNGKLCPKCKTNISANYSAWCKDCLNKNQAKHRAKVKSAKRREVLTAMAEMTRLQSELVEMELPEEAQLKLALLFYNLEKALNLVTSKDFINDR